MPVTEGARPAFPTPERPGSSAHLVVHEVAAQLRCHERTVRRMIARGELAAILVAGRYLRQPRGSANGLDGATRTPGGTQASDLGTPHCTREWD